MPVTYPVIRKPASSSPQQYPVHSPTSTINMDRPLPPLPPLSQLPPKSPLRLQKIEPLKCAHERKISSVKPIQPFEDIRASSILSSSPPSLTKNTTPRIPTSPASSRRSSANSATDSEGVPTTRLRKRSSWLPGSRSRSRSKSQDVDKMQSPAWTKQHGGNVAYPLRSLLDGQKVPELWIENGDCLVYLFPPSSNRAASFRVPSHLLSSSRPLLERMQNDVSKDKHSRNRSQISEPGNYDSDPRRFYGSQPLDTPPVTPRQYAADARDFYDEYGNHVSANFQESPSRLLHLYFPTQTQPSGNDLSPDEKQRIVDVRNLFAFLTLQPLVSTPKCSRSIDVFLGIAAIMKNQEFTSSDGSSLGDAATIAFEHYMQEMHLKDVRASREQIIEALSLAEAMKSKELYDEAFVHAVGRYDLIRTVDPNLYNQISQITQERLGRAHFQLKNKQHGVDTRMTEFQFHSLFTGIAVSKVAEESKYIRFTQWQNQFLAMRKFVLKYYKELHGSWPPKPNAKKNQFNEGGLNRLVLKLLYKDLCQLYNFLVDRAAPTTRNEDGIDQIHAGVSKENAALRKLLSEYDRSHPPVQPAAPFDVPLIPSIETINPGLSKTTTKERDKEMNRRLKQNETLLLLTKSHNLDSDVRAGFLQAYKEFEYEQVRNKSAVDMADIRYGHWIFLYAVIQALPLLVIDAQNLTYTDGVEYFLCQPSIGSAPWVDEKIQPKKNWYGTSDQTMVYLPSDLIDHGVEAVYRRSHCWIYAEKWSAGGTLDSTQLSPMPVSDYGMMSPLEPPPGLAGGNFGIRPQSSGRHSNSGSMDYNNGFASLSLSTNSSPRLQPQDVVVDSRHSRKTSSLMPGLEKLHISNDDFNYPQPIMSAPMNGSFGRHSGHEVTFHNPVYQSDDQGRHRNTGQWSNSGTSFDSHPRRQSRRPSPAGLMNDGPSAGTTFDDILSNIASSNDKGKKGNKKK